MRPRQTLLLSAMLTLSACGGDPRDPRSSDSSELVQDIAGAGAAVGSPATTLRNVELCFEFANDFSANGGDFPLAGTTYKGRGVRFYITDALGVKTYYNADTTTGCKTVALDQFATYSVRVLSKATFADGNTINLMNDDISFLNYGWTATASLRPALLVSPSVTYTWPTVPGGTYTNNISTAMSALFKTFLDHGITQNVEYPIYAYQGPCSSTAAACNSTDSKGQRALFLSNDLQDKFVITHELGHLATYLRFGGDVGSVGGDRPNCNLASTSASSCANGATHTSGIATLTMGSEEYGNCAFNEGWAQFISASVWNRRGDSDCDYRGTNSWNNCYDPGSAASFCYGSQAQTLDTGFERDWLTGLWAIERLDRCAIDFQTIVDIVAAAAPLTWSNADAKAAILAAAPSFLSGSRLFCFTDTIDTRISR